MTPPVMCCLYSFLVCYDHVELPHRAHHPTHDKHRQQLLSEHLYNHHHPSNIQPILFHSKKHSSSRFYYVQWQDENEVVVVVATVEAFEGGEAEDVVEGLCKYIRQCSVGSWQKLRD